MREQANAARLSIGSRVSPPTDNIPSPRKRADFPQVFRHERTLANRLREISRYVGGRNACWCGYRTCARLALNRMEVAPAKNHLGEMDHPRLLCATEQVAPSALPSRFRASGSKGERWK